MSSHCDRSAARQNNWEHPRRAVFRRRCSSAARSPVNSRSTSVNRLARCTPRLSLRECRPTSSTCTSPPVSNACQSGSTRPAIPTLNHCRVTALRSFSPLRPISRGATPLRAARRCNNSILLSWRFCKYRKQCSPSPDNSKPSCSLTWKSSGQQRIRAPPGR